MSSDLTPDTVQPDDARPMTARPISRRAVLGAAAAGAGGLVLAGSGLGGGIASAKTAPVSTLPAPADSGIENIVVLMMENRSFDHMLGWLKGAVGKQKGFTYRDAAGAKHKTYHLETYQGCAENDPDHSYEGGRIQYNGGACDGWLMDTANDPFCIGYYEPSDLAFYSKAAQYWTVCDHYFAATMGPTYPNRFYMHSAQTDRQDDDTTTSTLPTIWDSLAAAGVSHQYYFSDIPFTALWGSTYLDISSPIEEFLVAAAAGTLPAVSFVDPRFLGEDQGASGDDHPHADVRVGQAFVNMIYEAVTGSPQWANTVFVINYDEWGGFFDHVPPTSAPDADPDNALRGFRTPAFVISPMARRRTIASQTYDHTSVLKMIEWRFGLAPLTPRDADARNIAEVLDFTHTPNLTAPQWSVPEVASVPCVSSVTGMVPEVPTEHEMTWQTVLDKATAAGFTLPS